MAAEGAERSPNLARIGKYEIVSKIGQGAMGEVYKARDTVLDRFVAIKTMSPAVLGNPEMGQRFLREAQSAARLNHPNVVTLHDFGEDAGQYYMAMELLDGEDLSKTLRRGLLPTLEDKLAVIEQILDGVAYAHATGVIHRDLKPPNIHVQPNGHIKVMDFGLARLGESEITRAGTVMGTPNYMSPEQVRGEKTGPSSDVFSLGAMFYEVIGGKRAFDADSMHAVLYKVTESQPAPLTEICADVPPVIVTFIWRALAKAPELRYRDAGQMREALDLCRRVFDGSIDEASAIAAMGEAPTILQSPGEAALTALGTELRNPTSPTVSMPRRSTTIRSGPAAIPSLRPTSAPSIRKAPGAGARPGAAVSTAPDPTEAPAGRSGLFIAVGVVGVIALAGLVLVLMRPAAPAPADDRQTRAAFGLAVEAQLDSARRSLEYKDPEGAIASAQKALQFDPSNAAAQDLLTKARTLLDGVEADAREARRAAEAGDLDAATAALSKVLEVMPKHPVAAELSTQLASRFKARADEALQQASRASETARRAGGSSLRAYAEGTNQTGLAKAAYGRRQFTEAAQHFAEARRAFDVAARDAQDLAAKKAAAPTPARTEPPPTVAATAVAVAPPSIPATPVATPFVAAPTPAPAVAAPPPVAQKPAVDEDAAVRQVVTRLKQAIEQKDLALYKRLRPDLKADEERRLKDAFQNVTSQQVEYAIESVAIEGERATVKVTRTGRVSGQVVPAVRQVLKMSKTDSGWVISEIGQ